MKKQSVDVLDAADAMERKMRWVDFKNEQENLLRYDPDASWNVGDYQHGNRPTHNTPDGIIGTIRPVNEFHMYQSVEVGETGLFVGQPAEVDTLGLHDCVVCEIFTAEESCWICGEILVLKPKSVSTVSVEYDIDRNEYIVASAYPDGTVAVNRVSREGLLASLDLFVDFSRHVSEAFRELTPSLQRVSNQMSAYMNLFYESQVRTVNETREMFGFNPVEETNIYNESRILGERAYFSWIDEAQSDEFSPESWYRMNSQPEVDPRIIIDDHFSPMPPLSVFEGEFNYWNPPSIVWPSEVNLEPSVPLPEPVFETPNWAQLQAENAGYPIDQRINGRRRR